MKLFATSDIALSIRKSHEEFTHVLVNRGYTTIKPVFFRSSTIADLPVYLWAWWDRATASQLTRWRATGGVLLDRYTYSDRAGAADVLLFVECPLTMDRLTKSVVHIAEYSVVPRPHTWRVHEQCVDLRTPPTTVLQKLWTECRGARLTDAELAEAVDLPKQHVMYMRKGLKPVEEWQIKPRLAPEFVGFMDAWKWIGAGRCANKKEVREAGHRAAVKEMARLGHIALEKYQRYPDTEPDWERLERKRAAAIADLAAVRSLVESLPDHLQA
ncbi:hypothetical protein [Paraburkholderia sp. D1E]|uniref:hypothetical protein n=1 Tax=Paraburkholderia sp. D1E TaxID=3461398 RepID=UPI004045B2F8